MDNVTEPTLHRKLAEAMGAIEWQPKTGRNQQQGYSFVSVERIKDSVRTELAKRSVMVYVSTKGVDRADFETQRGGVMHRVGVLGEVTFADGDSGELFTIEAAGEAMDAGDKALSKAQTAMVKNALIDTFLIPTGDDPDQETAEPQQARKADKPKREYGRAAFPADKEEKPAASEFRPLGGNEVPDDGQPEPPRPLHVAGMVQCESRSPFENPQGERAQCRREQGHDGTHRTTSESWSDADVANALAESQPRPVA